MQVEFTVQEAQVLINLIDLAVKNGGLVVAEASAILAAKIKKAIDAESGSQQQSAIQTGPGPSN